LRKAIGYCRVSTQKQGEKGYSLEAQEKAIIDFAACHQFMLVGMYTEIESGKNDKRPVLQKVLKECRKQDATLILPKLDRLSRRVSFISHLMESTVDFIAADYPHASKTQLHFMAVFAEWERDEISRRTKAGMAVKKSQGAVFGKNMRDVLSKKNKSAADEFARKMKPLVTELKTSGFMTVRAITKELKRRRIKTFSKKGRWHVKSVHNLLLRIDTIAKDESKQPNTIQ
jgi:DNA invertase Pin-like site-specific DNA recombinase